MKTFWKGPRKKCTNITNTFEKIKIWKRTSCTRNVPTLQTKFEKMNTVWKGSSCRRCINITNKFEKINTVWKGSSCTRNVPTLQTNLRKWIQFEKDHPVKMYQHYEQFWENKYSLKRIILYKKCTNITNKFEKIKWKILIHKGGIFHSSCA